MSDEYIDTHFDAIKAHSSDVEARLDDSYCTIEQLKEDNRQVIKGYQDVGEQIVLITDDYEVSIQNLWRNG
jgi:hypothetical protein